MTEQNIFPEKEVIDIMKYSYNLFGYDGIQISTIDALVDYLILVRVEEDSEFRVALGDGYYT